jgi:hypothetical protein
MRARVRVRAEASSEADKVIKIKTEVDGYNSGCTLLATFISRTNGPPRDACCEAGSYRGKEGIGVI